MNKKKALITGITGQDGSYLAEFLLKKNYIVHGIKRKSSSYNTNRIDHILESNKNFSLHYGDVTDAILVMNIINKIKPDEIYNLSAQSHVAVSFLIPEYTANVDALGCLRILEAIKSANLIKKTKFYQAGTSELFGKVQETPQTEKTKFYPRSPYGVSKVFSHWMTINYREAWNIHACSGILFNHESPLRGPEFVTRKISQGMAQIALKKIKKINLGNLNAERDWGFAGDYVEAMWLMLQKDKPDDYVIATGETHSVRDFVQVAANSIDIDIEWNNEGNNEVGICKKTGNTIISVDKQYTRPSETDHLLGDASKAKENLGWKPSVNFQSLVNMMVEHDLKRMKDNNLWF